MDWLDDTLKPKTSLNRGGCPKPLYMNNNQLIIIDNAYDIFVLLVLY
tara:strand:- start:353 stop:493 length:141 start_codon:yes stop_codon:yes gene_type:complete